MVQQITALDALRDAVAGWKAAGETIALVPTMGALHNGHLALVAAAKRSASRVLVSIFVNPMQFGANEDFSHYPRPLMQDVSLLTDAQADALWLPDVATMYPAGFATRIEVAGVSEGLCGASRPGHFDGVATVVAKLLLQVQPDLAWFGEKDYQQLCVIQRLVADLNIPVAIHGLPTVREADGLALSSRNQYLSEAERSIAPQLYRSLQQAVQRLQAGEMAAPVLAEGIAVLLAAGFSSVDYLELRAEHTLTPQEKLYAPARLLVAARLGATRLIDNLPIGA